MSFAKCGRKRAAELLSLAEAAAVSANTRKRLAKSSVDGEVPLIWPATRVASVT